MSLSENSREAISNVLREVLDQVKTQKDETVAAISALYSRPGRSPSPQEIMRDPAVLTSVQRTVALRSIASAAVKRVAEAHGVPMADVQPLLDMALGDEDEPFVRTNAGRPFSGGLPGLGKRP